jgi:hypothetical protein
MTWFRRQGRGRGPTQGEAIAAFWQWWVRDGAHQVLADIDAGDIARSATAISAHVGAIHPDLQWEVGPGSATADAGPTARHSLVVTSGGDPALRATARRWLRAAPVRDGEWEYADLRRADEEPPDGTVDFGDHQIDFGGIRFVVAPNGHRLDVIVHHPAFADLPGDGPVRDCFVILDTVLGEEAVELWVGALGPSEEPAPDGLDAAGLRAAVADLRERAMPGGEPSWQILEGEGPRGPVLALSQVPLHPLTAPHLDAHVTVVVPYAERTDAGLPSGGSLDRLRRLEDHLAGLLGDSGRVVAHESSGGVRVLHVYVDGSTPADEQLRAGVSGWEEGRVTVDIEDDPGWEALRHLAG